MIQANVENCPGDRREALVLHELIGEPVSPLEQLLFNLTVRLVRIRRNPQSTSNTNAVVNRARALY